MVHSHYLLFSHEFFPIPILTGYLLILVLTGAIGYAYYNEEHTLSIMDEKNRSASRLRTEINDLNMQLTTLSLMGETAVEWTDGERENRRLNTSLRNLISYLDGKEQAYLAGRECEIAATREESYRDIGMLTAFTLLMLLLSYAVIHRDMLRGERDRRKLEESILENKSLLEMRKKIILTISHDIRGPLNVISGRAELAINRKHGRSDWTRISSKSEEKSLNFLYPVLRNVTDSYQPVLQTCGNPLGILDITFFPRATA